MKVAHHDETEAIINDTTRASIALVCLYHYPLRQC